MIVAAVAVMNRHSAVVPVVMLCRIEMSKLLTLVRIFVVAKPAKYAGFIESMTDPAVEVIITRSANSHTSDPGYGS